MKKCRTVLIKDYEQCREFIAGFQNDPNFSDPMLCEEEQVQRNLIGPIEKPDRHCVFGVYRENCLIGLFAFLVLRNDRYLEMLAGLSREKEAYEEAFRYLEQYYPGYNADFVFNPGNDLLHELLTLRGTAYEPEQQKLRWTASVPAIDTTGVELLSENYAKQYCAIHNQDLYWTGEKVMQAQDQFRTFLAICDGEVVGYLDVTCTLQENEPFDLLVLEKYRRMGYGRKLLAKALELNRPHGMALLVDVDNIPAIRLYESMSFVTVQGKNNLTAHWTVPKENVLRP